MEYTKYPAPMNFRFVDDFRLQQQDEKVWLESSRGRVDLEVLEGGLVHLSARLARTDQRSFSAAELVLPPALRMAVEGDGREWLLRGASTKLRLLEGSGALELYHDGELVLASAALPVGVSGNKTLALLRCPREAVVLGLGEKAGRLDRAGRSFKMWNIDVLGDLRHEFARDDFDPMYVTIPLYISRSGRGFFGVFLDNPGLSFIHTRVSTEKIPSYPKGSRDGTQTCFGMGTTNGPLDLYLIPGPELRDVVRRFARLSGVHELPPLWALGYHQCRWSYRSAQELERVSARLARARIPVGAIWMDIDYMDGFRCFTFDPRRFSASARSRAFAKIRSRGSALVSILDPGIKAEPGYFVYDEGVKEDIFCKTPEGGTFHGFAWPEACAFPDFSLPEARAFWARHVKRHLGQGFDGIWLDMNDPSLGPVESGDMLFGRGELEHHVHHNQYGHLMAKATWQAFQERDPDGRPFILTRSGCSGTQKYSAIWCGDNVSSDIHLAMSIPMCLNLALSGVSFCGADIGGFAGDCNEKLLVTWTQAGALLPFFRNHSQEYTRAQEPYAFSNQALQVIKRCIDTRLKLLPYLYTEFYRHWRDGDAIIRPLSYEFPGTAYQRVGDQFLLGSSLMLAPFLDTKLTHRLVLLPPGYWFDLQSGRWVRGGRRLQVRRTDEMILFVRDGSILPCLEGGDFFPQPDLDRIELHVFVKDRDADTEYYDDDRRTRAYQHGDYHLYGLCTRGRSSQLTLDVRRIHQGTSSSPSELRCYFYGARPAAARPATAVWPFRKYRAASLPSPVR